MAINDCDELYNAGLISIITLSDYVVVRHAWLLSC